MEKHIKFIFILLKAEGEKLWGSWILNNKTFDKLIIEAQYEDGKIYSKEIWTKCNYDRI